MERDVSIVGATGYAGAELCALLARHPRVRLASLFSGPDGERAAFESLHPSLVGRVGPDVAPFSLEALLSEGADLVFLATPHETSAAVAPRLLEAGSVVIDLSGAFRLPHAEDYPRWYRFEHPAPGLLSSAVYGLTEWCDGALAGARLVANPGCYATAVLLALKPLRPLLAEGVPVVCDAMSGVSGAGKRRELAYSFAELSGNVRAYGVGTHRHEPEMRAHLGLAPEAPFAFVPHLLPAVRGILATLHVPLADDATGESVAAAFDAAYRGRPFVTVRTPGDLPDLRSVVGTPRAAVGFSIPRDRRRAVVVCVIDNLLKGAASQAVQNMNRVFGWDETEGLA